MVKALSVELASRKDYLKNEIIETVYFGGGTPSLLEEQEFKQIFQAIRENYALADDVEFCLEANPDDIKEFRLAEWKMLGFNRLSIGIQSFREKDLKWMNRAHSSQEALECIPLAKNHGFTALSLDLIYGLPDLNVEEWKSQIQTALDLGVEHISAYCLTGEEITVLA